MSSKLKVLIIFSLICLTLTLIIFFNHNLFYYKAKKIYHKLPGDIKSVILLTINRKSYENVDNDYNVPFLPNTQFIDLDFSKKDMSFDDNFFDYQALYSFYIDIFKDSIILTTKEGSFFSIKIKDLFSKGNKVEKKKFKTNINFSYILDSLITDDKLYISAGFNKDDCDQLIIYHSDINVKIDQLNFKILKKFEECANKVAAGRLQPLKFQSKKGLLISTAKKGIAKDDPDNFPQDENSIFGKTIFIDLDNKEHFMFSKGHRNTQGLFVNGDTILSTDHGPRGGDEINEIFFEGNYGWPISSYGEADENKSIKYKDSHVNFGFIEPIFSFVPSIGISELYLIPNDFNEKWKNSILVTSLNGKTIYRLQFQTNKYQKIIYVEPIYIGQRIRDIKYIRKNKTFLIALETLGELGILRVKD